MTVNLSMLAGAGAQFFDNNGVILSGGLVYTYAAGTTTPQAAYTTSSGSIAHTNPIVLDSAGRVASGGEIWLTDAVAYKFVLKTSAAITIGTYDNVTGNASGVAAGIYATFAAPSGSSLIGYSSNGSVATTVQARLRQYVSVKDFGAVGDGTTDDTTAINNTIIYVNSNGGGAIYVPPGTYKITNSITVLSNVKFFGAGRGSTNIKSYPTNPTYGSIVVDGDFAEVSGFSIDGSATVAGTRGACGIFIITPRTYCKIYDNEVYATADNGIESDGSYNEIYGNYVHDCYTNGIYVIGQATGVRASYNSIHHNICIDNSKGTVLWDGIDIDPVTSFNVVESNFVLGNDIILFETAAHVATSFGNRIINNQIVDSPENGINVLGPQVDYEVSNNYIYSTTGWGIVLNALSLTQSRFVVENNWILGPTKSGISIDGVCFGFTVSQNRIENASTTNTGLYSAIDVIGASYNFLMEGNQITDTFASPNMKFSVNLGATCSAGTVSNNYLQAGSVGVVTYTAGQGHTITNNTNYNPVGFLSVAVPVSGVGVQNPYPFPCMVSWSGGTISNVAIDSASTKLLNTGTAMLGIGQTITMTYTVAPVWSWFGM